MVQQYNPISGTKNTENQMDKQTSMLTDPCSGDGGGDEVGAGGGGGDDSSTGIL